MQYVLAVVKETMTFHVDAGRWIRYPGDQRCGEKGSRGSECSHLTVVELVEEFCLCK